MALQIRKGNWPKVISVVTPTLRRPQEIGDLLENLSAQELLPAEVIIVDGAPAGESDTENVVRAREKTLPFPVRYLRHPRGTAIQRNAGIDRAVGSLIALIDDDVRLEADFLQTMLAAFATDEDQRIGGIVGYRTNQHFDAACAQRWRWYRRLKMLTTYEPGRYDFRTGYPINANLQPPFTGVRAVDFMKLQSVWRGSI